MMQTQLSVCPILVMVRYSVLSQKQATNWKIGQKSFEEYRSNLFDPDRLDLHQHLFASHTLPSLSVQTVSLSKDFFRLLVFTSSELPKPYLDNLKDIISPYDWAEVILRHPEENMQAGKEVSGFINQHMTVAQDVITLATVRLDDDDALSNNFIEQLLSYTNEHYSGHAISFGNGFQTFYDRRLREFTTIEEYYDPKSSVGLSYISTFNRKNNQFTQKIR